MKNVSKMLTDGVKSKCAEISRQAAAMVAQLMSAEMAEDEDAARHDVDARKQAVVRAQIEATDAAARLQAAKVAREAAEEAAKAVPIEEQCDKFMACRKKNGHRGNCITGLLSTEERTGYLDEVRDCVVDPYNKAVIIPAQHKIIRRVLRPRRPAGLGGQPRARGLRRAGAALHPDRDPRHAREGEVLGGGPLRRERGPRRACVRGKGAARLTSTSASPLIYSRPLHPTPPSLHSTPRSRASCRACCSWSAPRAE